MQLTKAPMPGDIIARAACTNIAMAGGNEELFRTVIDGDEVKDWVGIGWVPTRRATQSDRLLYPILGE